MRIKQPMTNAIVVMFDSLQFNYLGCYGNDWIKTPNFDRFAREGILFENAYSNGLPTLPVRRSMLTGRYTLHDIGWAPLRQEDTSIADLCWGTGIDTAIAYNTIPMFMVKGGFARSFAHVEYSRGFENTHFEGDILYTHHTVEEYLTDPGFLDRLRANPDGEAVEQVIRRELDSYLRDKQYWKSEEDQPVVTNIRNAIALLKKADRTHPFFMWIDSWDPHEPWAPPSTWDPDLKCPYDPDYAGCDIWFPPMLPVAGVLTEEQMHHTRMLYAETITMCDKYFAELIDTIRSLGYEENTLVWLCSDHGEPMGNGEHGHGLMGKCRPWPYEELVHIPLVIRAPGLEPGKRIKAFVQDCDCAPTILDWLGLPIPANMTGKSLLPLCRGEVEKVRDFAVSGYYSASWSIITEDWSFIHWLDKLENGTYAQAMAKVVSAECLNRAQSYLREKAPEDEPEAVKVQKEIATLDGEDQWTCTLGARMDVPDGDELYDRRIDPFQLNNVIGQHPEIAKELYQKLTDFMTDLINAG